MPETTDIDTRTDTQKERDEAIAKYEAELKELAGRKAAIDSEIRSLHHARNQDAVATKQKRAEVPHYGNNPFWFVGLPSSGLIVRRRSEGSSNERRNQQRRTVTTAKRQRLRGSLDPRR